MEKNNPRDLAQYFMTSTYIIYKIYLYIYIISILSTFFLFVFCYKIVSTSLSVWNPVHSTTCQIIIIHSIMKTTIIALHFICNDVEYISTSCLHDCLYSLAYYLYKIYLITIEFKFWMNLLILHTLRCFDKIFIKFHCKKLIKEIFY